MLSHKDVLVQEQVRQDRLRECEHERLVKLVSQQNQSDHHKVLDKLWQRSNLLRRRVDNKPLVN